MSNDLVQILVGDCRETLKTIPDAAVQCCVTSPPYWGLRDYGHAKQLGNEKTPEEYVSNLLTVFSEVYRVLKRDGTLWLNLGDSYCASGGDRGGHGNGPSSCVSPSSDAAMPRNGRSGQTKRIGMKPKDLVGIPWMVAFALRAAGWYLRSDIIWHKPNPMPESVRDRPTRAHEYIFLLTKSGRYYYDHAAIKDPPSPALVKQVEEGYNGHSVKDYLSASVQDASATKSRIINGYRARIDKQRGHSRKHTGFSEKWDALTPAEQGLLGSNKRSVWNIAPANFKEAHFATFPPDLIIPCILAGSKPGDTILDPFGGAGTVAMVAVERGRKAILCELNPAYVKLIEKRIAVTPGFF